MRADDPMPAPRPIPEPSVPVLSPILLEMEDPPGGRFHGASDVAVDDDGNLVLFTRCPGGVFVYGTDGACLRRWETPPFVIAHGITIGPEGAVCLVDQGDHAAFVYADGERVGTMGNPGRPSDTGCQWQLPRYKDKYLSITQGGPPFNNPTKAAFAPDGSLYISDGYGNTRVHHFSPSLELLASWGEPGSGSGEFRLPHSVCVLNDGRVVVADRENERLQVFTSGGEFIEEWTGFQRPSAVATCGGVLVVAELAWRKGDHSFAHGHLDDAVPGGVSVVDLAGRLIARYRCDPGASTTWSPHGLAVTQAGTAYLVDLTGHGFGAEPDASRSDPANGHRGIVSVQVPVAAAPVG
jgi:DNA-binding beta-propeller fold protein YncE